MMKANNCSFFISFNSLFYFFMPSATETTVIFVWFTTSKTNKVNLIKGDRVSTKTDYRDALSVNMYAVQREILGAKGYMLCYPGLTQVATGSGVDRGANYNERFEEQYRVSDTNLIRVNTGGSVDVLGAVPGTLQAAMPYSFNTQAVIADGNMFLYSPSGGFEKVTDPDLGEPIDGVWVDGYYFLTDGEFIYHTDITDESSIDPLKFATAEFMPDPSLGVAKTQDNKVMVFGRYSLEYFINVATSNFAFRRVETRAQKIGIVATHAKCESGGNWFITGGRKEESLGVYVVGIGSSEKVSTREIDKILAEYTEPELSDMRMESRSEDGQSFVIVHLPSESLLLNISIMKVFGIEYAWSILKTDVQGDTPYRAINGVFDANRGDWIYGDKYNSNIGKLDNSVCTHYDEIVEWLLFSPLLKLERASIDELEFETIPGHTTSLDATVSTSLTYNGLTYGKEWYELYGAPSDYSKRFIIRRLGYVPDMIGFKFRGASSSRMAFSGFRVKYG